MVGLLNQKQNTARRRAHRGLGVIPFKKSGNSKMRSKARLRGGLIAYTLIWFYPLQLLFAFLFLIAMGAASSEGFIAWLAEDLALAVMMLSWIILIALGTGFMIYANIVFYTAQIPLGTKPAIFIAFAVCLWGYWAPFLFFFPWVFLYIGAVINAQK